MEPAPAEEQRSHDPDCYLCPGNARAGGARNPQYEHIFVFDNDFPALTPDVGASVAGSTPWLLARPEPGICRVVCFSPRHDTSVPRMTIAELREVVDVWVEQYRSLGALPWVAHVQIFENRGASMGASNPHPHGQIWANASVPGLPDREQSALVAHRAARGACLLCEYLAGERSRGDRIVCENEGFAALVPFWAVWPFEVLVVARQHRTSLDELSPNERTWLADVLKRVTTRYDNLFHAPCPYSMGFHQKPTDGEPHLEWHLHAHFYPPLLRSATVHKFMVGYELLANAQRDLTAEDAAARLREVDEIHYRDKEKE